MNRMRQKVGRAEIVHAVPYDLMGCPTLCNAGTVQELNLREVGHPLSCLECTQKCQQIMRTSARLLERIGHPYPVTARFDVESVLAGIMVGWWNGPPE